MDTIKKLLLLTCFACVGFGQAQQQQEDLEQIDNLITRFYEAISFDGTKTVNYPLLDSIYHRDAIVGKVDPENFQSYVAKDFRERNKESFKRNHISSFREQEIKGFTHIYGGTATRFSLYEYVIKRGDEERRARGVNNMQLVKTPNEGWKVLSNIFSDNHSYPDFLIERVE
ncbi:MAG: hypothetical protein Tsb004_15660 [Allomuricauda sp.]